MQGKKKSVLVREAMESERLSLRLLHIDDVEAIYQYAQDPKVAEN